MKTLVPIHGSSSRLREGNALLIALIIAAILTPMIWSAVYMAFVQQRTVALSQQWNGNIPVVEAGVNEAFAHLNNDCFSNAVNLGAVNWENTNGWSSFVTNGTRVFYLPRRQFADGSYYDVKIVTNNAYGASEKAPQIICVGSVSARTGVRYFTNALFSPSSGPQFATINTTVRSSSLETSGPTNLMRQVRVTASRFTWTDFAVLGDCAMTMNGQGTINSFNSAGGSSFWGQYVPYLATDQALVGSVGCNISLGPNSRVYGSAMTSTTNNISGGSVGDTNWVNGGNSGVQTNHYTRNLDMDMPAVVVPEGMTGWPLLSACAANCTVTYTRPSLTNGAWISDTTNYPSIIPPGGLIITNTNGFFTSQTYFTNPPGPPYLTVTNWYTNSDYASIPPGTTITQTNYLGVTWRTNTAPNSTSPAQDPTAGSYLTTTIGAAPTGYYQQNPAGVYVFLRSTSYTPACGVEESIPVNCYVGSVTNNRINCPKGVKTTNYTYALIWQKRYQVPQSTNYVYQGKTYYYATATYSYLGPQTNNLNITDTYAYIAPGGDWYMPGLSLSGQQKMLVTGGRNRIYMTGDLRVSGRAQIVIAPGSSLELYMAANVSLGGNGILNEDAKAYQLMIYGLCNPPYSPGCNSIQISGNTRLVAGILAPCADIRFNGGGSRGLFVGAAAGGSVTFNGDYDFAYDQDLGNHFPPQYFIPKEWREEAFGAAP